MGALLDDFFAQPNKVGNGRTLSAHLTSPQKVEVEESQRLICEYGCTRTLEIGLALGASAVGIAEISNGTRHVALDPFQHDFDNIGLNEIKRLGLADKFEFVPERSEDYLHRCAVLGSTFDFIFIDGYHTIGQKVTDVFLADKCLEPGGIVAIHDAFIPASVYAVEYLQTELGYHVLPLKADAKWKLPARMVRYGKRHGLRFAREVVPYVCRSVVALRKPR